MRPDLPIRLEEKVEPDSAQIKHMVDRFLGWRLPENFSPDAGISFDPEFNKEFMARQGKPPTRHEPTGTNLFDARQAEAMVRYMLDGLPSTPASAAVADMIGFVNLIASFTEPGVDLDDDVETLQSLIRSARLIQERMRINK